MGEVKTAAMDKNDVELEKRDGLVGMNADPSESVEAQCFSFFKAEI
jgi:hypothetical protein